jgi:hypothetical protein
MPFADRSRSKADKGRGRIRQKSGPSQGKIKGFFKIAGRLSGYTGKAKLFEG